jgi:hypothetical protein
MGPYRSSSTSYTWLRTTVLKEKKKIYCNPHQQAPVQVSPHLVPNLTTIQIPLLLNQTMKPIADINTYHICSVT